MATVPQSTLREYFSRELGFWYGGTNTGTANNTVVDANIERYDTGRLRDKWVLMTTGLNDDLSRRIASVATSAATLVSAFGSANANGNTFEIVPYDPDVMQDALQIAGRNLWPKPTRRGMRGLYLPLTNETLIVDNLLLNPSFENGTFTSWVNIATPTNTASTARRVHGAQSAQIAASGATEGIEQNVFDVLDIDRAVGKTLHFQGWVWASVASAVRLRITFNGTTFTNGPWHSGNDAWEGTNVQRVEANVPADATEATVSCEVTDGNTGYFDLVSAWVNPITEYTMPTAFYPHGPSKVFVQRYADRPEGDFVSVGQYYPRSGMVLRLEGPGRLTIPTTDAGTIEIDDTEAELLVAEAAAVLFRNLAGVEPELREQHRANAQEWQDIADQRRESFGKLLPSANKHVGWRVSPEEARILYLDR